MTGRWTTAEMPDLAGRRALVTGVTSGIGETVAAGLARRSAEVLMAGRDERRLSVAVERVRRETPGAVVCPVLLDLADLASVRRGAAEASTYGPIDVLVNNAGVMAPPYARTVDGFELQLGTNHLGHFALTGLLLPMLVASGDARVVTVSSQMHRLARTAPLEDPRHPHRRYRKWEAYSQSKLANLLFMFELDRRARAAGLPLRSVAAHPGLASTGLMRSQPRILDAAVAVVAQRQEMGALPLLMAATADLPGGTYVGPDGPGQARGMPRVVGTSRAARDPEAARRLWEISQDATGVFYP